MHKILIFIIKIVPVIFFTEITVNISFNIYYIINIIVKNKKIRYFIKKINSYKLQFHYNVIIVKKNKYKKLMI